MNAKVFAGMLLVLLCMSILALSNVTACGRHYRVGRSMPRPLQIDPTNPLLYLHGRKDLCAGACL